MDAWSQPRADFKDNAIGFPGNLKLSRKPMMDLTAAKIKGLSPLRPLPNVAFKPPTFAEGSAARHNPPPCPLFTLTCLFCSQRRCALWLRGQTVSVAAPRGK